MRHAKAFFLADFQRSASFFLAKVIYLYNDVTCTKHQIGDCRMFKVIIDQPVLSKALVRGGYAAMTAEGQSENTRVADPTRGCIKIVASKEQVSFESTVSQAATKFIVPVDGTSVVVENEGELCVPIRTLQTVVNKGKSKYKVAIEFIPLAEDEVDNTKKKSKKPPTVVVQNNGKIVVWFSNSEANLKHNVKTFPTTDFEVVPFQESPVTMKGKAEMFSAPIKTVAFAVETGDANEVYNHVGIDDGGDKLYFFGSNGRRCAVVSSKKSDFELATPKRKILVDLNLLTPVMDMLAGETISMVEDTDDMHITFLSGNTWVRLMGIDIKKRDKYPDFNKIMSKSVDVSVVIHKDSVVEVLDHVSAANKERSRYEIKEGASHIAVSSKGVADLEASSGWIKCDPIAKGLATETICLSTSYFIGAVNKLSGDKIRLAFTPDTRIARLESETNPEFTYLMQKMQEGV